MVSRRNQSSHVKAFPAMKHARTLLTVVSFRIQEGAACVGHVLIGSNHTTCAGNEEGKREDEDKEALAVDKVVLLGPWVSVSNDAQSQIFVGPGWPLLTMQKLLRDPSHNSSVNYRQEDCIAQVLTKPHAHRHAGTSRC